MKRLYTLLLLMLSTAVFVSCHKDPPKHLSVDNSSVMVAEEGGSKVLKISSNVEWTLHSLPSWITADVTSGSADHDVNLTVAANISTTARTADLVLSGSGLADLIIKVTQSGAEPFLTLDKTTAEEKGEGQQDSVSVITNTSWTLSIPSSTSWIVADKTSGTAGITKVHFTIAANTTTNSRVGEISFGNDDSPVPPVKLTLTQERPDVVITSFTTHAKGGEAVTIIGTGFSTTASDNEVKINDQLAQVTSASTTSLTVTVPMGAGSGPISVRVNTKSATTPTSFIYDWVAVINDFAGSGSLGSADATGTSATFRTPYGITTDAGGNIFVADLSNHLIRKITPSAVVSTYAGNKVAGWIDGPALQSEFYLPYDVTADASGNIYVADYYNNVIRKITPSGVVSTYAGTGVQGYADGSATQAMFSQPIAITADGNGNLYVLEYAKYFVRKISPTGVVSTIAGSENAFGFADGVGASARFGKLTDLAVDASGTVYVADNGNNRIRKIAPDGTVSTVAGDGTPNDKDGTGQNAQFDQPQTIAIDPDHNLIVADDGARSIRKITAGGVVSTLTKSGANPYFASLAIDANGIIYVSEDTRNKIYKVTIQ